MIKRLTLLALLIGGTRLFAQDPAFKNAYRVEGANIVLYLDDSWSRTDQEKLLVQSGMDGLSLDTLWKFGSTGRWAKEGWNVERKGKRRMRIFKSITQLSSDLKWEKTIVVNNDLSDKIIRQTTAEFGINAFRKPTVTTLKNGATRFYLAGKTQSREVYLSGTFNSWSTLKTSMTRTDSGWITDVVLKPGKHCYKFIVGGRWMSDPENLQHDDDGYGNTNSIYFVTNVDFRLKGFLEAKAVILTGTFVDWKRDPVMKKDNRGWILPVYLRNGTYQYKFIVDNRWITDPSNPELRDDGKGNTNSFLRIGAAFYFRLKGYPNAKQVMLSGEFNKWTKNESMIKMAGGWELPYALAPGNYQYRFIVDGDWMTDPANPHLGVLKSMPNSIAVAEPNHTFVYTNATAKSVKVSGNFNGWTGYDLQKRGDQWTMKIYLKPGKTLYKFIVDGVWILDPANELWEQNEHNTGNSVMWKTP